MEKLKKITGFTLIELLVSIVIIGILASISVASINDFQKKAHEKKWLLALSDMKKAIEIYYIDHGEYPVPYEYYPAAAATTPNHENLWNITNFKIQMNEYTDVDYFLESMPEYIREFFYWNYYKTNADHPSINSPVYCPGQTNKAPGTTFAITFTTQDSLEIIHTEFLSATQYSHHFYCVHS